MSTKKVAGTRVGSRIVPAALVCGAVLALSGCSASSTVSAASSKPGITKTGIGLGVTDKYEIGNATTEFAPDTPKIVCVWKAEGLTVGAALRGVWIAEDVGKAAPANYKI